MQTVDIIVNPRVAVAAFATDSASYGYIHD